MAMEDYAPNTVRSYRARYHLLKRFLDAGAFTTEQAERARVELAELYAKLGPDIEIHNKPGRPRAFERIRVEELAALRAGVVPKPPVDFSPEATEKRATEFLEMTKLADEARLPKEGGAMGHGGTPAAAAGTSDNTQTSGTDTPTGS